MRLRSIKLSGFKSFVDPTTVPFHANMTAVVGPNGCGKSNIIDAVRWVMGESSVKTLRGQSMTDVIFNGSASRKPVSRASIELTFDNSDGLAGGEFARFSEISVRRDLTRDAQSKYFLNGSSCRRRDVTDLFLGTGLGPRSYAIIEQGMIARIVESKPEELRTYVEEAAGVSKYKERRRETGNRINRTRENLERLNDLSEELGRHLSRLKSQADSAERYKALKGEVRQLEALLLWYDLQTIREQASRFQNEKSEVQAQLDQFSSKLSTNERTRTEGQVKREEVSQQLDSANASYYAHAARLSRLEAGLESEAEQIQSAKKSLERLINEVKTLELLIAGDAADGQVARQKKLLLIPEIEAVATELGVMVGSTQDVERQLDAAELKRGRLSSELGHAKSELTRLEIEKSGLDRQQKSDALRLEIVEKSLSEISQTDPELIEAVRHELTTENDLAAALTAELHQSKERCKETVDACLQSEKILYEAEAALHTAESERSRVMRILEAETRIDDKGIEAWAAKTAGICGRVHEYIQLPQQQRAAFEATFPKWLSAFVIDDLDELDVDALPAGVRVVSRESVKSLRQRMVFTNTVFATKGDGYTASGLKYGVGWLERVNWSATGVLDLHARMPELDKIVDAKSEKVFKISEAVEASRKHRDQLLEVMHADELRYAEIGSKCLQLKNRLLGLEAQAKEVLDTRERLTSELRALFQAQENLVKVRLTLETEFKEAMIVSAQLQDGLTPLYESIDSYKAVLNGLRDDHNRLLNTHTDLRVEMERIDGQIIRSETQIDRIDAQLTSLNAEFDGAKLILGSLEHNPQFSKDDLSLAVAESQVLENGLKDSRIAVGEVEEKLRVLESERLDLEQRRERLNQDLSEVRLKEQAVEIEQSRIQNELKIRDVSEMQLVTLEQKFAEQAIAEQELIRLEARIERLGPINLVAVDEYQRELQRKSELDHQYAEVTEALETLEGAIRKIDRETRALFRNTFDSINAFFGEIFPQLFGGGEAWLMLTDEDLLATGVTIMARPPGKRNSSIYLLSGGEKALTALALVFAIFQLNPAPFCLLDEVDAPLDDANVLRYADAVAKMAETVQFIYITHNKISMERAEQLMGVTMSEPGVSRMVSVDIDRAVELATQEIEGTWNSG